MKHFHHICIYITGRVMQYSTCRINGRGPSQCFVEELLWGTPVYVGLSVT